jgi:hypothetical protein
MVSKPYLQSILTVMLAGGLALAFGSASAVEVTPQFRFLNFYASGLYASTAPDNVDYFVNGSKLCAWGPANGSTTTTDCAARGDGGMSFPAAGTPVTNVEWFLVNKDEPPATREWFHNAITFAAGSAHDISSLPSDRFLFGTLTFTNGSWASVTDARVELSYELTFTTGDATLDALYDFEYSGTLVVAATPNDRPTREGRADFVYLADQPQLGSLRAFEFADVGFVAGANTVSVDIYGNLASVHFTDLANVRGGGFVNSSVSLPLAPVPEPSTFGLTLAGLAALFVGVHRSHRRRARGR